MKATKLLLVAALFTGLTTLSIAGPGSDYWAQQTKNAQAQSAKKEQAQVQPKAETPVQTCSHCGGCGGTHKM